MSLLDAIPGLSTHAPEPVVVGFDTALAAQKIRQCTVAVADSFPGAETWIWLRENRPEVIAELKKAGHDINAAYKAEDMPELDSRIDRYISLHNRAWHLHQLRDAREV